MYDDLIRVLVFYIGVKQKKKKKRLNFVVLYLENTYKSTKNKVYCSNWETIAKKKKNFVVLYLEITYRSTKNKEYCSSWETAIKKMYIIAVTKKPLLQRDL